MFGKILGYIKDKKEEASIRKEEASKRKEVARQRQEALAKEYHREYCFWGEYEKEVEESGLKYSYSHQEIFLANDNYSPKVFMKLSGSVDEHFLTYIKEREATDYGWVYTVEENGQRYRLSFSDANSLDSGWLNNHYISREEAIYHAKDVNYNIKASAKERARARLDVEAEFGKE